MMKHLLGVPKASPTNYFKILMRHIISGRPCFVWVIAIPIIVIRYSIININSSFFQDSVSAIRKLKQTTREVQRTPIVK